MTTATFSDYRDPEEPADWHDMPAEPPIEERLLDILDDLRAMLCEERAYLMIEADQKLGLLTDYFKQAIADRDRPNERDDPECADPFADE